MAQQRRYSDPIDGETADQLIDTLRYLADQIRHQREDQVAQNTRLEERIDRLATEFQEFRLQMTRDFTQLNTQVQTGVKMGWAMIGLFVAVIVAILAR